MKGSNCRVGNIGRINQRIRSDRMNNPAPNQTAKSRTGIPVWLSTSTNNTTTENPTAGENNQVLNIDSWNRKIDNVEIPTSTKNENRPRAISNEIMNI
jgi:hypothetical protein